MSESIENLPYMERAARIQEISMNIVGYLSGKSIPVHLDVVLDEMPRLFDVTEDEVKLGLSQTKLSGIVKVDQLGNVALVTALGNVSDDAYQKFMTAADEAWDRYRAELAKVRQLAKAALAERTRKDFPDATGIVIELDMLSDDEDAVMWKTMLVSVEGPNPVQRNAGFEDSIVRVLKELETDVENCVSRCSNHIRDWAGIFEPVEGKPLQLLVRF